MEGREWPLVSAPLPLYPAPSAKGRRSCKDVSSARGKRALGLASLTDLSLPTTLGYHVNKIAESKQVRASGSFAAHHGFLGQWPCLGEPVAPCLGTSGSNTSFLGQWPRLGEPVAPCLRTSGSNTANLRSRFSRCFLFC